jgi:ferrous iron transport protein A
VENSVSKDWQCRLRCQKRRDEAVAMVKKEAHDTESFSLRLAQEGEWVRIVSVNGGKGFHERLAGLGLRVGAEVQVLQNLMNDKLLLAHQGARFYLGGGMAHKIQVAVIEGEDI